MRHERLVVILLPALIVSAAVLMPSTASVFGVTMVTAAQDVAAVEATLGFDRPTRRLIQQGLAAAGFDPGPPDGLFGPRTREAIRRWQAGQELPVTGYLDGGQAEQLHAAGSPPALAESATVPTDVVDCGAWNTAEFFEIATVADVVTCLAAGADVAARDEGRHTPLHWAASHNENPAVLEALLYAGADLTVRDDDGLTPVRLAAEHNSNAAVVRLLVAAEAALGSEPSAGRSGQTPASQSADNAELPPDILLDSYLLRAEQSVRDGDRLGARAAMQQLVDLQDDHELVPEAEYHYRYASVWNAVGAWERALASVRRYLQLTGRDGEHYLDALTVMNEATTAIEEADRERARRAADEARRRAAAERARAEAARQLNAARAVLAQMEFVRIPPGQFRMSPSDPGQRPHSTLPRRFQTREVRITRPFEMGRYEVTQAEWVTVMGSLPFGHQAECGRCPIGAVTWDELQPFISVLNTAAARTHTYRLPTEAEWEYAARAGENRARFVRDLEESAWHEANSGGQPHPVGLKRPNEFGLYDMIGNVAEWMQDIYGYYPGGTTVEDPQGPRSYDGFGRDGPWYVVRGCDYRSARNSCERGGIRYQVPRWNARRYIGFRLVRAER